MDNIICMKWGTKYPPHYVNILAAMVRRHLTRPHRFVCFTEDAAGLNPEIEVRPLPELDIPPHLPERGWRKLTVFGEKLADLEGTALYLDLDIVILDSLEPFFEVPGEFRIIKDWDFPQDLIGNSSVFRFEIGQYPDILDNFIKNRESIRQKHRNEQAYLSYAIAEKGILDYWPEEWCRSFKRSCLSRFPKCYFTVPKKPKNAKIVVFHGNPNPDTAVKGWVGKYGFRVVRPTPWVRENWRGS
ncbi:MAG: hypothetical protein LBQ54_08020 [Planctomycetaceae bacterium]|jgi:hypothetical protein|nr:hypothetical protein [Planctomycetaceae bacterium]